VEKKKSRFRAKREQLKKVLFGPGAHAREASLDDLGVVARVLVSVSGLFGVWCSMSSV